MPRSIAPRPRSFLRTSRLEQLESRSLLAGDVVISQVGVNTILTGDLDSNDIVITASDTIPGQITITSGDDPTTINGSSDPVTLTLTGDLRILLGDGADVLAIVGNTSGNATIPEDLIVDLDGGTNSFRITDGFAVAQDFLFSGGNDGNALNIDRVATGRNLRVTSGSGGFVTVFSGVDVAGDLRVSHTGQSGNVLFMGGSVDGPVVINQGDALIPGSSSTFLFAGSFGNNVSINHAPGSNAATFGGISPITVAGNLNINSGGIYSLVDFNGMSVAGNVTVTNGPGSSQIHLGYASNPTVTIGGTARLTSGDGDSVVTVDNATIGIDLIVQTGAPETVANDIRLGLEGAVNVARDVRIVGGSGADQVQSAAVVARDLIFNLGTGANDLDVTGSKATRHLLLNDGDDLGLIQSVDILAAQVTGDVRLSSAAGSGSFEANVNGSTIGGQLRFARAAGNGSYNVGLNSSNTIGGNVVVAATEGTNSLSLNGGTVGGSVVWNSPAGTYSGGSVLMLNSGVHVIGNVVMNSGMVSNHFGIIDAAIDGSVTINHGAVGSNSVMLMGGSIGGNLSVHFGAASNNFMAGLGMKMTIAGSATILSDGMYLAASVSDFSVGTNLTITQTEGMLSANLGSGVGPTEVGGTLRINNGNGFSMVFAENLHVTLDVLMNLNNPDPSQNMLFVGTASTVVVGRDFKVTGGAGRDNFFVLQLTARDIILNAGDGASDLTLMNLAARDLTISLGADGAAGIDPETGEPGVHSLNVRIDESAISRNLRVTTGTITGVETIRVRATDIVGNATFTKGDGSSAVNVGDFDGEGPNADCAIGGNVTLTGASGGQTLTFHGGSIGGAVNVTGGDVSNVTSLNNAHIVGNVNLAGTSGSNLLFVNGMTIDGSLTANYGDGSNFYQILGGTIGGNVVLRGGLASTFAMIGSVGVAPTTIHGRLDFGSAGLFGGLMVANAAIDGNFLFTNGDGFSSVSLGQPGGGAVTVGGLVRVTTAIGGSSIQASDLIVASDFIATLGNTESANTVDLGASAPVVIGRDLTLSFGNGTATANVANTNVTRNLKITSLNGADTITVNGGTVGGNTTIDTGDNGDTVSLGLSAPTDLAHGSVTVRTGAGDDIVSVGSNTLLRFTPTPNFFFDGGTENDSIDLYFALTGPLANRVKNFETITTP